MVRKGKLAIFESSNISKIGEVTPTKIGGIIIINEHFAVCMCVFLQTEIRKLIMRIRSLKWRRTGHRFNISDARTKN